MTDTAGQVVQSYSYGPFGETTASTGEANPFQYAGRENDPATGLYYHRARYYRPEWGRFLSADPIGFAGGLNHYTYGFNNPLSGTDPSGLDWLKNAADFAAGWGDKLTFGATAWVRDQIGVGEVVNGDSLAYGIGDFIGGLHQDALLGGKPIRICFPGGTPILTPHGEVAIERVREGDWVRSADPVTGKPSIQRVAGTFVNEADALVTIATEDGGTIEATAEHPFFVVSQGFVEAGRLVRGDLLVDATGRFLAVLEVREKPGKVTVYNFEVEGTHTYYAAGWWVHNRCGLRNVSGGVLSEDDALSSGIRWLGPGYREIAPGVFRSADNQRQFRMTTSDLTDPVPHVHFEAIGKDGRDIIENAHINLLR